MIYPQNVTLRDWLVEENHSDFIEFVPEMWLSQEAPGANQQFMLGISVLTLCLVHNVSAVLLIVVFVRLEIDSRPK